MARIKVFQAKSFSSRCRNKSLTNKTPLYGQYYPDKLEFWNILFR
jgi:hypothetical protein